MPRSTAAWIVVIDPSSSVPPHIQPPIAQVPRPTRETLSEVSGIVANSMSCLLSPLSLQQLRIDRQCPDPLAGCGVDRVADRRRGRSELILFEEGPLDSDVNRPFGRRAESPRTFGDRIRIVLDRLGDLVEEFMDGDEGRPAHIPMRLLDLCVQIDGRGQMPVQNLGSLETNVLGKRVGRAVHLCSPQLKRHSRLEIADLAFTTKLESVESRNQ